MGDLPSRYQVYQRLASAVPFLLDLDTPRYAIAGRPA
jgi:hypothetical protein